MKKRRKYEKNMPGMMYTYFHGFEDTGAPSFSKFARRIGATLEDITQWREHTEFDRAWRECNEIRRDYLIDNALTRRHDPSFVKFLLTTEFGMGEDDADSTLDVRVEVIE